MDRVSVTSSVLASIGYDSDIHLLEVEFVDGKLYHYFAVPEKIYKELLQPPGGSIGRYFGAMIRNRFPSEQI